MKVVKCQKTHKNKQTWPSLGNEEQSVMGYSSSLCHTNVRSVYIVPVFPPSIWNVLINFN